MKIKQDTVKIITLGCSKNLVDSEHFMGLLRGSSLKLVGETEKADTVIINTCGFIESAKQESIDTILANVEAKNQNKIKNLFVVGCLSERYKKDLKNEIPEVDKYFGTLDRPATLRSVLKSLGIDYRKELIGERVLTTPGHFAYLKISEGCNNPCSFCAIPLMRGSHKSFDKEKILAEAEMLAEKNVKELLIIGQDTTYWGYDLNRKREIASLLNSLSEIPGIEWLRLMYTYPTHFPEDLIREISENEKICNYIDMPIQHISDKILKSMRRGITKSATISLLEKLRNNIPDLALRTTLITGFPGETMKEFEEMLSFVLDFGFNRLGVFTYSEEDDTYAKHLRDDIPEAEKLMRLKILLDAQQQVSHKNNEQEIGKTYKVLVDRRGDNYYAGRTYKDAPEVDQEVIIDYNEKIKIGNFYNVKIYDSEDFDLFGSAILNGD
jgi:MiaB-like tRNA modifying enzyme YliG, TIGR01125